MSVYDKTVKNEGLCHINFQMSDEVDTAWPYLQMSVRYSRIKEPASRETNIDEIRKKKRRRYQRIS